MYESHRKLQCHHIARSKDSSHWLNSFHANSRKNHVPLNVRRKLSVHSHFHDSPPKVSGLEPAVLQPCTMSLNYVPSLIVQVFTQWLWCSSHLWGSGSNHLWLAEFAQGLHEYHTCLWITFLSPALLEAVRCYFTLFPSFYPRLSRKKRLNSNSSRVKSKNRSTSFG